MPTFVLLATINEEFKHDDAYHPGAIAQLKTGSDLLEIIDAERPTGQRSLPVNYLLNTGMHGLVIPLLPTPFSIALCSAIIALR